MMQLQMTEDAPSLPSSQALSVGADTARDEVGKAIFILGPSSSGKTTLCNALAKDMQLSNDLYVKEVARHVMKTQGFSRNDVGTYEMQAAIMHAQLQAEVDVLRHADAVAGDVVLLSDRSAIDPIVYLSTAKNVAEGTESRLLDDRAFQAVLPMYRRSVFVVLHPVKEWIVDDGVRSLEDPCMYLQALFQTLQELHIRYVELEASVKDLEERVAIVKRYLAGIAEMSQVT